MDDRNDECAVLDDLICKAEMNCSTVRRELEAMIRREGAASARLEALQDAKAAIIRARKKPVTP